MRSHWLRERSRGAAGKGRPTRWAPCRRPALGSPGELSRGYRRASRRLGLGKDSTGPTGAARRFRRLRQILLGGIRARRRRNARSSALAGHRVPVRPLGPGGRPSDAWTTHLGAGVADRSLVGRSLRPSPQLPRRVATDGPEWRSWARARPGPARRGRGFRHRPHVEIRNAVSVTPRLARGRTTGRIGSGKGLPGVSHHPGGRRQVLRSHRCRRARTVSSPVVDDPRISRSRP